ncbi:Ribosomal protein S24/S35, mitochondrial, conserved domain [Plasmopara halstedii]|uniref:Ribosomal protein S24/S35, mitochondrial, conserved domain n=1 Tax=Plasmopara halstedii TaxID=4781 RepID=A0A0P1A9Y2_PLAHL|nr:Ribosomal protein S24/S35, mitochondrial, conserved domain [Plasmopara halstedii]CEG36911.1 Ribosomal protein S24/S35, mitochondrial, conserved domain [Plasmopara halstedii]|eukprot:XP_024573280.1 Ribosomal protein S24/S35, mitochondrial, conserved domain [Plasmopara halstedii]
MLARCLTCSNTLVLRQSVRLLASKSAAKQTKPTLVSKFRKKKTFQFSGEDVKKSTPLEQFVYPAYWDEDYPKDFDNEMKHEVEKLQVFADFTPYLDLSWQSQIHPLFNGEDIEMTLNCPLEDFDERLFINDKNTHDTKVVMEVPMTCFKGLDNEAKNIVIQLAGPRYNANKKMIKIAEDRYNKRVYNHKRICEILRDLTETALKLSGQALDDSTPENITEK